MIVEAIAQTGGVLMSKSMGLDIERKGILFMSLDRCRFRAPVRPGEILRMPVDVIRARPTVAQFKGRAMVGDNLIAEVEFMATVVERS
jgi:3-hydroxyacyl-[acyl-carrier-protein] dehydratase